MHRYAILDTGAGRNFVDLAQLHTSVRDQVVQVDTSAIIDASRNRLKHYGLSSSGYPLGLRFHERNSSCART